MGTEILSGLNLYVGGSFRERTKKNGTLQQDQADATAQITFDIGPISLGAGTFDDNKIRIESNELIGNLDVKARAERSQFDKAPLDSKKLGVYFSPQTMINEDVIAQLGFTELDDFIGDPGETEDKAYPKLVQQAQSYWKKYEEKNDINAYIKIFTLFDLSFFKQLEQLLPARVDLLSGILIQPNILERNKDKILPKIERFDVAYNTVITDLPPTASGDYVAYTGDMEARVLTLSAIDDDQYQGFLTASTEKKYNGTQYTRDYLIKSGSTYISASSPYWISEGVSPVASGSSLSEFKETKNVNDNAQFSLTTQNGISLITQNNITLINNKVGTITYTAARVSDFLPTGIKNQKYNGAKMTSANFNVDSPDTIDGKPVVEFRSANPNQLIYQTNGTQGSFIIP